MPALLSGRKKMKLIFCPVKMWASEEDIDEAIN